MESDIQQIRVDLQSAVGVVGQNLLGQNLAQLDTFLVEGVHVPGLRMERQLLRPGRRPAGQGPGQEGPGSRYRRCSEGLLRSAEHLIFPQRPLSPALMSRGLSIFPEI